MSKKLKRGDCIVIREGTLKGTNGRILAVSPRTGGLSVELLEDCGAYVKTDVVHVAPYEVELPHAPA